MIKSRLALARQDDDARLARMRQEEDKS